MNLDALARASCAIYVNGHRDGSGTLITDSHVLTAAHVLRRGGPLAIRFLDGPSGETIPAERLPLGAGAERLDIAVLKLGPGTGDRPSPAKLWPTKRLPPETKAFGYPIAEGPEPLGVWRDSAVSGAVLGGRVQLDWDDVGTLEGHSGGPVCDKRWGHLVGVLVEGSEAGHFDRMVTLAAVRTVWDGLPRPWLFAGQDAPAHFKQRASGQRSTARGGDLFRGRREAVARVQGWLCAAVGREIPLVIIGQPGAGKSAVLARAVLAIEDTGQYEGVAFHAREATVADLVDAVSATCGLDTPSSWRGLVDELKREEDRHHQIVALAVDALDEAQSYRDIAELRLALCELAKVKWLRVAVATRPLSARDIYGPRSHLHELGVTSGEMSSNLIDLDSDMFFAAEDLIAYADALLAQDGVANPGPPGGAWEFYRQNEAVRAQLANIVASRAGQNYLIVGLSAFQLAEDDTVVDPWFPEFDPSSVPSGIGEALTKHLERLSGDRRWQVEGLLTALAYGRGTGLDDLRWLAFTRALGYDDVKSRDLAQLKASAAADYLLETSFEAGGKVTRLFHQALIDELVAQRDRPGDEARLVQLLRDEGAELGWLGSSSYARDHAPSHAVVAGQLEQVLRDAEFLVSMAPDALISAMAGLPSSSPEELTSIYREASPFLRGDPEINAPVLEFFSRMRGNNTLAQKISKVRVKWLYEIAGNIRPFNSASAGFCGRGEGVWGVAALAWPGLDHPVIVTTSVDRTARVWDPRDPGRELARFDGHTGSVWGVAALAWPGLDHPVIVTTSSDATARLWDPRDPGRELARFDGHTGSVWGVAALAWPGLDHQVVVTTSLDASARVWDPRDPGRELARFDGHTGSVYGIAALAWPGLDHPVIVTTSGDGTARVWDPRDPGRELARFNRHTSGVRGVGVLEWPGLDHQVVVTTSLDATARVWDPRDPGRELARLDGHTNAVLGVTALASGIQP